MKVITQHGYIYRFADVGSSSWSSGYSRQMITNQSGYSNECLESMYSLMHTDYDIWTDGTIVASPYGNNGLYSIGSYNYGYIEGNGPAAAGGSGNVRGIRPVVALKSTVQLQKTTGNNYIMVSANAEDTTPPSATFSPNGNTTGKKSQSATVTIKDESTGSTTTTGTVLTPSQITGADYGGYLVNYIAQTDSNVSWRIFYADSTNIYLIADRYIGTKYIPKGKNGTSGTSSTSDSYKDGVALSAYVDYAGSSNIDSTIMSKLLTKFKNAGYSNTNNTMKKTAYLLDKNIWTQFKDTEFASYAIGAPTIELLAASYNKKHSANLGTQVADSGSNPGYKAGFNGSYNYSFTGIDLEDTLYITNKMDRTTRAQGYYIASPTWLNPNMIWRIVWGSGSGVVESQTDGATTGIRPIVVLNSDVGVIKRGNGVYELQKTNAGQAQGGINKSKTKYVWLDESATKPTASQITNAVTVNSGTEVTQDGKTTEFKSTITKNTGTGKFKLWLYLEDNAGNSQIVGSNSFYVDNTAPNAGTMTFKNADGTTYTSGTDKWTKQNVNLTLSNGADTGTYQSGHKQTTYTIDGTASTATSITTEGTHAIVINTTDNAGNVSSERSYTVNIDKTNPSKAATMTFKNADGTTYTPGADSWTKQNVTLTLNSDATDALSGVASTTYTIDGTASTATSITTAGQHTIVVTTKDKAGNAKTRTYKVNIDKTNPSKAATMTFKNEDGTTYTPGDDSWTKQNVTLTLNSDATDALSGVASTTYTIDGTASTATSITTAGQHTIVVTTKDKAGNAKTRTYKVNIDKTKPTLTVNPTSATWRNSALSVTVTHNDTGGSGVASTAGEYFLSTSASPTSKPTGTSVSGTYTSGTAFNINPGTSGQYYLFVKEISDNATNKSSTTNYVTIGGVTYHRYGLYQFDKTKPTWQYSSKDIYYSTSNDAGNDEYANKERTVVITFTGQDALIATGNNIVTSTLTKDDITVLVNGTAVSTGITKDLDIVNNSSTLVTGTLTIKGITGDGPLTISIPSGKLKDVAGNTSNALSLSTDLDIDIDNTSPNLAVKVTNPTTNGAYMAEQTLTITATYNENIYKEITSNTLIDTKAEAPTMTLTFGGVAAKGTVTCSSVNSNVFTYTYTITDGDNGPLKASLTTVYDAAGNSISATNAAPTGTTINADTQIPTIDVVSTASNTAWYNSAVSVIVTKQDPTVNGYASGVASAQGEYFLSTKWEPTEADTIIPNLSGTYESGTPFEINPGISGQYYLYVRVIKDKAKPTGNESATDDEADINDVVYHRYAGFNFDYDAPTINVDATSTGDDDWYNTGISVEVTHSDAHSGVASNSGEYFLSTSATPTATGSMTGTYGSDGVITINPGTSGKYYLFVKAITDNAKPTGNVSSTENDVTVGGVKYHRYGLYQFDYNTPTIDVMATASNSDWYNTGVSVKITHNDEHSGVASNSGNYFLSTSETPTSTGSLTGTYTSGTAFTINPGTTGQYYLFVKEISDKAKPTGNKSITTDQVTISGVKYHRYGIYKFDYDNPTLTVTPTSSDWKNTGVSITVTHSDSHSGVASNSGNYFLSTSASPTAVATGASLSGTYTNGTAFTINPGTSGQYYLYVKAISDKAKTTGNVSSTANEVTVSGVKYHRYGLYKFDYDRPTISVNNSSCNWRNSALSVTITANDTGGSGLSSSNSYQWYLSKSATALTTGDWTGDTWTNFTSGTAFNINPGKDGVYYLFVRTIQDNAGNVSNQNGDMTTVDSVTYHRFGTYKFDYTKPTWQYSSKDIYYSTSNDAGNDEYANRERKVVITFTGQDALIASGNNIVTSTLTKEDITVLVNGTEVTTGVTKTLDIANNTSTLVTGTLTITGITGDGPLTISIPSGKLNDVAGNTSNGLSLSTDLDIDIDNTSPNLAVKVTNPTTNGAYMAEQTLTITATYNENIYKEITSNTLIDTKAEAPTLSLTFGGVAAKGTVTCSSVNSNVFTYTYTIKDGDNGQLKASLTTVYDAAGNSISATNSTPTGYTIYADTQIPTINVVSTASHTAWYNTAVSVIVTKTDPTVNGYASGLVSEQGEYFISTKWEPTEADTIIPNLSGTYESGTPLSINPGISGQYYLYVKAVKDKAKPTGNESATDDEAKINGVTYHRYGPFKFDYDNPTIAIDTISTGSDWYNVGISVKVTHSDAHSGVASNSGEYFLSTSATPTAVATGTSLSGTYTNGTAFTINPGTSGQYYLFVKAISDKAKPTGNVSGTANEVIINGVKYHRYGQYNFDYNTPIIDVMATASNSDWYNTGVSVKITHNDEHSGVASDSGNYFLSTSETPTATGSLTGTYTSGTAFTINPGTSGQYYLFVKEISDKAKPTGNKSITTDQVTISGVKYHRCGIYKFDYDNPTLTVTPTSSDWKKTGVSITVTHSDSHSGVASNSGNYFLSTSASPTAVATGASLSGTYTSGTAFTINPGTSGQYYLYVKAISDKAKPTGNVSSTANEVTISGVKYHRYGLYKFDYESPIWTTQNINVDEEGGKITVELVGTDALSGYASDKLSESDAEKYITVYVDGVEASSITKTLSTKTTVSGGVKYTLTLSGFEEGFRQEGKLYKEWSGTVSIVVAAGTLNDIAGNTNVQDEYILDYIDVIEPEIYYTQSMDKGDDSYTLTFQITDKYYDETKSQPFTIADIQNGNIKVLMTNGQYEMEYVVPEGKEQDEGSWEYVLDDNGNRKQKVWNLKDEKTTLTLNAEPLYAPAGTKVTNTAGQIVSVTENTHQIGHEYTLKVGNLDPGWMFKGENGLNYSGIITVSIPGGRIEDREGNKNNGTTITSQVNYTDGPSSVVDVVEPEWSAGASVDLYSQTALITMIVTDKYFEDSDLELADLQIVAKLANGNIEEITDGIVISDFTGPEELKEERLVNGVNVDDYVYGHRYTVKVTGFSKELTQLKVKIPGDAAWDQYGNYGGGGDRLVYNVLRLAGTTDGTNTTYETEPTSPFLGSTKVQRQDIEKIVIEKFPKSVTDPNSTIFEQWDVSAAGDGSIIAWTTETTAPFTVHIFSGSGIFGNVDSSYLFSYIGYGGSCNDTEAVRNLNIVEFNNLQNMSYMFNYFGYRAMTSLDLGNNFNTGNVTNMEGMFYACGYSALTNLSLGSNFDTSEVKSMSIMFNRCGYEELASIDLGDKFDTSNVINMAGMFQGCGYNSLTNLDLGDLFDTGNVKYMSTMFNAAGRYTLTTLDLGDKFDTRNTETMYAMFSACYALTNLDLGPQFTAIPNPSGTDVVEGVTVGVTELMFRGCGENGTLIIYAPESIYGSQDEFKLGGTSTTKINEAAVNAIDFKIIPQYRPKWEKTADSLDIEHQKMTVTVKGTAYQEETITIDGESVTRPRYVGTLTSNLSAEDITVFVDGVEVTNTTNPKVTVSTPSSTTTAQGSTIITHTIELENLEEAVRQAGIPYKQWSGNFAIRIGGRGKDGSTYGANVLVDQYGNQSMMQTDEGQAAGTWINVTYKDANSTTNINTDGTMFADFIRPEFTYKYTGTSRDEIPSASPEINYTDKEVSIVFDVTDKYFDNTDLATEEDIENDLIVKISGYTDEEVNANIQKILTKVEDIYYPTGSTNKVGERYKLVIKKLEQVDANGMGDGFKFSGYMDIAFPADIVTDKSENKNIATTISIGLDEPEVGELPNTEYSTPYLPTGYTWVAGTNLDNGLVVQDKKGNQYVWIEIPRNTTVYTEEMLSWDIDELTGEALTNAYTTIESKLNSYTNVYFNGETSDNYPEDETLLDEIGLTREQYIGLKQKMLKSVFKYGGFYVGRYETGIEDTEPDVNNDENKEWRKEASTELQQPVIKQNAYPYNYVTVKQAQTLANKFSTDGYTGSLMFNMQWKLILKYLETKGILTEDLDTDSTSWGNLYANLWTSDENSKYSTDNGSSWTDGTYSKVGPEGSAVMLSTGASSSFGKQNIYDIAGNMWEWTLATYVRDGELKNVVSGGCYSTNEGRSVAASSFTTASFDYSGRLAGFRVALFKDDEPKVVDVVDPIWEIDTDSININASNKKVTVDLIAKDKYYKTNTLTPDQIKEKITIYIDGEKVETTLNVKKTLSTATALPDGTGEKYTLTITDWEEATKQAAKGKNFFEWSGTTKIEIEAGTAEDQSGNTNKVQELTLGHVDFIAPKVEEVSSARGANSETIIFNVMDKYLDALETTEEIDALANQITVYVDGEEAEGITKTLTKVQDFKATVNGNTSHIVGQQFKLELSDFEQATRNDKDYKDWSGTVSIKVAGGAVQDLGPKGDGVNPNKNDNKTITGDFVDFIEPDLEYIYSTSDVDTTNKKYTMTFSITDKYYSEGEIENYEDLSIEMRNGQYEREKDASGNWQYKTDANGNRIPIVYDLKSIAGITITLRSDDMYAPVGMKYTDLATNSIKSVTTAETYKIGHTYTLTIEGLENLAYDETLTTANYSGIIDVGLTASVVKDHGPAGNNVSPNGNIGTTITSGVDIVSYGLPQTQYTFPYLPEGFSYLEGNLDEGLVIKDGSGNEFVWIEVPRNIYTADTLKINLDMLAGDKLTAAYETLYNEMDRYTRFIANNVNDAIPDNLVDATGLTSIEYKELKQKMLKSIFKYGGFYVGRYETGIPDADPSVNEWRTSVTQDIANYTPVIQKNAYPYNYVTLAQAQEIASGEYFATDGYQTSLMYELQWNLIMHYIYIQGMEQGFSEDEMIIELNEDSTNWGNYKYSNWTIQNDNAKYMTSGNNWTDRVNMTKELEQYVILSTGASETFKKQNIYDLAGNVSEMTLGYNSIGNENEGKFGNGRGGNANSGEGNCSANIGAYYAPNSGTERRGFRISLYKDDTSVVDVVDPRWEKVSSYANAREHITQTVQDPAYPDDPTKTIEQRIGTKSTATIRFRGTDTYFDQTRSTLTEDDVIVVVNGLESTDGSITITNFTATPLYEDRWINGVNVADVQYGIEYTITLEGFDQDANQVKVRIPSGKMVDVYGNVSESTDLIIYNVLKKEELNLNVGDGGAYTDEDRFIAFLGESTTTRYPKNTTNMDFIQRQDIQQIIFVNSLQGSTAGGVQRVWDVSAMQDDSIKAWTSDTTAPYTVYIGSNHEIFANPDSTGLFACIGSNEEITYTESETLQNLELLNTSGVTKMKAMFFEFGYRTLTSLDLGDFDTSNVTNMLRMFYRTGYNKMTSLNLGNKFDTSKVTDMRRMFAETGYERMTTLDFGDKFNTINVTNMIAMFFQCGYTSLTTLDLGEEGITFDTRNVTDMGAMFQETGCTSMTTLDLGDYFDTSSVTSMDQMFAYCGNTVMTTLDLGDKFDTSSVTNMKYMFAYCGEKALTSLDLGDKFNTTNVENMYGMFGRCKSLTTLDLGPAFTTIPDGTVEIGGSTYRAYDVMFSQCGTSDLVIYAPEAIYANQKAFKLNNVVVTP